MLTKPLNLNGTNRDELADLADVAGNLAAGNGGPTRYRKPASGLCTLPDYGRGDLNVICMETPHRPMAALFVAVLVLYGLDFQDDLERLGIHEISVEVFEALQREFGRMSAVALGTNAPSGIALPSNVPGALNAASAPPAAREKSMLTLNFSEARRSARENLGTPRSHLRLPAHVGLPALPGKR